MNQTAHCPVGVFDSGVGGLTVTRAIVDRLPREAIVYLGDTARVPYGNKSPETIQRYSTRITERLLEDGAKAIVIACNTASALAMKQVQETHAGPVIGVIDPVCERALEVTKTGSVGVIGTRGTIQSGAYPETLLALRSDLNVITQPCPMFVPLAEEGWLKGRVPLDVARTYLERFVGTEVDTLILGCTHYPLLKPVIEEALQDLLGRSIQVIDSAQATADRLCEVLEREGILQETQGAPKHRFLVTDDAESFRESCKRFFGAPIGRVEQIEL